MAKLVLKTAGITFSFLIAVALILFGVISLFFPALMLTITDNLGLEGASAYYSVSVYDRSGKIEDLAEAVERSYDVGHYGAASKYGKVFLEDENFKSYCAARDLTADGSQIELASYESYAVGLVVSAYYLDGAKDIAFNMAFEWNNETFSKKNPVVSLTSAAIQKEDKDYCLRIIGRLEGFSVSDENEQKYLNDFLDSLRSYCAE